jgi:hypothetical protein
MYSNALVLFCKTDLFAAIEFAGTTFGRFKSACSKLNRGNSIKLSISWILSEEYKPSFQT